MKKGTKIKIGEVYRFTPWEGCTLVLVPASIASTGRYKGACVVYFLKPAVDAQNIKNLATEHLLCPPMLVNQYDFKDGEFVPAGYAMPDFRPLLPHVFLDLSRKKFFDENDNELTAPTAGANILGLPTTTRIAFWLRDALGADVPDELLFAAGEQRDKRASDILSDDSVNAVPAALTLLIPSDFTDNEQPIVLGDLAERLDELFKAEGLGYCDGDSFGESACEIHLVVKARKYRRAVQHVRDFFNRFGIENYELSGELLDQD